MRVTFPDPILETLTVLRAELPAYSDSASVDCGSVQVEEATAEDVTLPYLMVALDDAETRYPVTEDALLRVTVWASDVWKALRIAQISRAVLRDHAGSTRIRSYGDPSSGPFPTEDPDSGQPITTQTITARLKSEPL